MRKLAWVFGLVLLLFSTVQAASPLELSTNFEQYSLLGNDQVATQLHIANPSSEKVCFALDSSNDADNHDLETSFAVEELCLNARESTTIGMTMTADAGIDEGTYEVQIKAEEDNGETSVHQVEVLIDNSEVDFRFPRDIRIANEGSNVKVVLEVRNDSGSDKEIRLMADSELFLPHFDPDKVQLEDDEGKEVALVLNLNPSFQEDRYTVTLYAIVDERLVKRTLNFRLEPGEIPKPNFQLNVPNACFTIEKGDSRRINFGIENHSQQDREIELSVLAPMKVDLNADMLMVEAQDINFSHLVITPGSQVRAGTYDISVFATQQGEVHQEDICVKIPESREVEFELLSPFLEVEQGNSRTFEVEVTNNGDQRENVAVSLDNPYDDVQLALSSSEISIPAFSSEQVLINVAPDAYAALGEREVPVTLKTLNAPSVTPVSREQAIVVDLDDFTKEVVPSTVKFRYNNVTYNISSTNVEFDAGTNTILFYPPTTLRDNAQVTAVASWEDTEENLYRINFGFDVGDSVFDYYFMEILVKELRKDIDPSTIEFDFEGDRYELTDPELRFFEGTQELEFRPAGDVRLGERLSYKLAAEDEDGRELNVEGTYTVDFSGAGAILDQDELTFDIEHFEDKIRKDSIEVRAAGLRFDDHDAELDIDLDTDREDGSIVLARSLVHNRSTTASLQWEDEKNNAYFLSFSFIPGSSEISNLELRVEVNSLTADLDEDRTYITWNGFRFNADDEQLEVNEVGQTVTFTPTARYFFGDTFEIGIDVEDTRGRSFITDFDLTPSFSGTGGGIVIPRQTKFEAREDLRFRVVEPRQLQEGGMEFISFPIALKLAQGEEKDVAFIMRNLAPITQEGVEVKALGFTDPLFFTGASLGGIAEGGIGYGAAGISARADAAPGFYTLTLEARSKRNVIYQDVEVEITPKKQEPLSGLAGLVGLINAGGGFGLGFIVLVIIGAAYAVSQLRKHEAREGKQPWMRKARSE